MNMNFMQPQWPGNPMMMQMMVMPQKNTQPMNMPSPPTQPPLSISLLDFCTTVEDLRDTTPIELEFLYEGLFLKLGANMIISKEGVGKSLIAKEIVDKSPGCKKVLHLLTEDFDGLQLRRYIQTDPNKQHVLMNNEGLQRFMKSIENRIDYALKVRASHQAMSGKDEMSLFLEKYERKHSQLRKANCIGKNETFGVVLCFILLVEELKRLGFDTIVIDSFLGLENGRVLTREQVSKMVNALAKAKITSIWVHHLNDKNESHGPRDKLRLMDYVYTLEEVETKENGAVVLEVACDKNRYQEHENLYLLRERISDFEAKYTKLGGYLRKDAKRHKQLGAVMLSILESWEADVIARDELEEAVKSQCGEFSHKSLTNVLTALGKEGVVQKEDSTTWDVIRILKS